MLRINLFFVILCVSLNAGCSLKKPVTCIKGQTECSGGMYRTCDEAADEWVNYECSSECNTDGTCIHRECNEEDPPICNTETSELRVKKQCVNGTWQISLCYNTKNCEDPCIKFEQSESSICTSDDNSCIDLSNGESVLLACENNKYKLDKCPDNSGCSKDGKFCGSGKPTTSSECKDGAERCTNDAATGYGRIQICSNNQWKDETDGTCLKDGKPVSCADETKCGNVLCKDGYATIKDPANPDQTIQAYCINNVDDLIAIRTKFNSDGTHISKTVSYILTNDINIENSWIPIGTEEHPFNGILLGNSKAISMKDIKIKDESNFGLFGVIKDDSKNGTTIRDLTIYGDFEITDISPQKIGILAGATEKVTLLNIKYSGSIHYDKNLKNVEYKDRKIVGGLIGHASNSTNLNNISTDNCDERYCINLNTINSCTGGLIGYYHINDEIMSSITNLNINASINNELSNNLTDDPNRITENIVFYTGGIIGSASTNGNGTKINNFYYLKIDKVLCDVKVINNYARYTGGVLGQFLRVYVSNVHATVNVLGSLCTGGIAGFMDDSVIENSFVRGDINGDNSYVGGISGYCSDNINSSSNYDKDFDNIINSYVYANIKSTKKHCGGICGSLNQYHNIKNAFYIGNSNNCAGLIGRLYNAFNKSDFYSMTNSYALTSRNSNYIVNVFNTQGAHIYNSYISSNNLNSTQYYGYFNDNDKQYNIEGSYGRFAVSAEQVPTIMHQNPNLLETDSKKLIDHLGDDFTLANCKVTLNEVESDYILPVFKTEGMTPDFCKLCSEPDSGCPDNP